MEKPPIEKSSDNQPEKPKTREEIENFYFDLRLKQLKEKTRI